MIDAERAINELLLILIQRRDEIDELKCALQDAIVSKDQADFEKGRFHNMAEEIEKELIALKERGQKPQVEEKDEKEGHHGTKDNSK